VHPTIRLAALAVLSAALVSAPRPAQAETYQTCAGFIDSLPATISTQGTWCLRGDLSTAMTSGAAITIAANNITIDCNDFKLGGLAAGDGTATTGILAENRINATVRNCNVRGFKSGTDLNGSGHAVLDSKFDSNTYTGIAVTGEGTLVQGNRVNDTGGSPGAPFGGFGIAVAAEVAVIRDNFIQGVFALPGGNGAVYGVHAFLVGGSIEGNIVASLQADGTGQVYGIDTRSFVLDSSHLVIRDNVVSLGAMVPVTGRGVSCEGAIVRDNTVSGATTAFHGCVDAGGNFSN